MLSAGGAVGSGIICVTAGKTCVLRRGDRMDQVEMHYG